MIVPNLTHLNNATELLTSVEPASTSEPAPPAEFIKTPRKFGRPGVSHQVSTGIPESTIARGGSGWALQDRQSCASGTAFYSCANGFRGCCSVDPCNPGSTCPDGQSASGDGTTLASSTHATTSSAQGSQSNAASALASTSQTATQSSAGFTSVRAPQAATSSRALASSTASAITTVSASSSSVTLTTAPTCPSGNGTTFSDSSNIAYKIHCNTDNPYESATSIQVGTGGYGECFSACSNSSSCAGFTFVGLTSGSCYLKQQMPSDDYVTKNGTNYISCAKINATAAASSPSDSGSSSGNAKKTPTGAIVGGIIGGLALLALLLLLVALLAKRRRRKIEERRATISHTVHGPLEAQEVVDTTPSRRHERSGSTAHDAFAPFGGFYRGFSSAQADGQVGGPGAKAADVKGSTPPPTFFGGRKTGSDGLYLPTAVYQRPANPSADAVAMLDGTPIARPVSSDSRSSRFREHVSEMEDTSHRPPQDSSAPEPRSPKSPDIDSPTLGRISGLSGPSLAEDVRRKQHLMSWNNYHSSHASKDGEIGATMEPRTPPSMRRSQPVSPDLSNTPRDSTFVVSPFGSLDRGGFDRG